jgi:hypothetical protein
MNRERVTVIVAWANNTDFILNDATMMLYDPP